MMLKQHSGREVLKKVKKAIQMVVGITLNRVLLRQLYGTAVQPLLTTILALQTKRSHNDMICHKYAYVFIYCQRKM